MTKREDIRNIAKSIFRDYKYPIYLKEQTFAHMKLVYEMLCQTYQLGVKDGVEMHMNYIFSQPVIEQSVTQPEPAHEQTPVPEPQPEPTPEPEPQQEAKELVPNRRRKAHKGRLIYQIFEDGRRTGYISMAAAARRTGICPSAICKCARGVYKTAGGYRWEFANLTEK